jgi:prolyl 4-hydroxylase
VLADDAIHISACCDDSECAPACRSCEMLDYKVRCPFDENAAREHTAWSNPGDLDYFFWSIARNETYKELYNLTVLSGPVDAQSKIADQSLADAPWVVQLEDFLSTAECNRLIAVGHDMGYERSKDVGKQRFDGSFESFASSARTSTTAWCTDDSICDMDPVTQAVSARIESLVGIPLYYSENIQLLRYEVGQRYGVHHDYTENLAGRPPGVRILTVFLYLNHDGLQGGGTNFPQLYGNLTVQPKQGRALLWPSVLNDQPGRKDPRTEHQALSVEQGVKYGANAWYHERDFRTPLKMGCTH